MQTTSTAPRQSRIPSWLLGTGVIAIAMAIMNLTTYGFTILAARLLGPAEYGALAAVMGLLLVVNVVSLGLQATGARRVSASSAATPELEGEILSATYRSALVLGVLTLAATPVITATLNLDSWAAGALVAVTAVPLTVMGGQAGILQGERRWYSLAAVYLCVGVGRMAFGWLALLVEPNTLGAMVGVSIGAVIPVVVAWWALRHPGRVGTESPRKVAATSAGWARGGVLRETMHNSHALLAFFALSNADVIIARITLDAHQAGLYAGGLILAKAVLFLPQFVVVIVFPSMSRQPGGHRMQLRSLAVVLAIGAVTVLGTAALSGLAVTFIGGPEYVDLRDRLWLFAVLGTLLALLQLMVYNVVARQRQRTVYVVWAALLVVVAVAPALGSLDRLLTLVLSVDSLLFLALLAASFRRAAPAGSPAPAASDPARD